MPDFNREMVYAGAEFSLQIFEALGVLGFSFGESHPDAAKRLTQMHIMMRRNCETDEACQQVTALARSLSGLLAEVIKILELPREHEFSHEARQIISELDNLLSRCAAQMPPDYMTFSEQADEIFGRGYSADSCAMAGLPFRC